MADTPVIKEWLYQRGPWIWLVAREGLFFIDMFYQFYLGPWRERHKWSEVFASRSTTNLGKL